jgi:eukaryotic-like serine/threonine-protein kinase
MADSDTLTGKMLGRFQVLEKVGEGGMGVVYRAEDTRLNREVALKLIHPKHVQDEDARRRFIREAQAASGISHPNVCTIHSIEEEDGQLFLVLEFLEGQTLKDAMPDLASDWKALLDALIQGAEGLAEAHRRNVVHRDIKSANFWITPRGLVKIMDFGLAKQMGPAQPISTNDLTADFTNPGVTVGTTHYMSPEQARGREVDQRSDIFSFGVVLYEVAVRKLPFTGVSTVDVLDQILHGDPTPLTQLRPDVPAAYERAVAKCLRKSPEERYQSAADLVVDLKGLRRDIELGREGSRVSGSGPVAMATPSGPQPVAAASGTMQAVPGSSQCVLTAPEHKPLRSFAIAAGAVILLVAATIAGVVAFSAKHEAAGSKTNAGKPAVAVLAFENSTGDPKLAWYGKNAAELLAVDLSRLTNVDVISKQRIFDVLTQLKMESMPTLNAQNATEVAKKCGARLMVSGETLLLGGNIVLKAEISDVSGGRLLGAEKVTGVTEKNMLEKADELGGLLRERLKDVK